MPDRPFARSDRFYATEIDGDDAAWLRGQLPPGAALHDRIEVDYGGQVFVEQPSGLFVPEAADPVERFMHDRLLEAEAATPRPVGVDLFCGAGGFTLGLHEAGFDVLAAAEWDSAAAWTYLHNLGHPDCRVRLIDDEARARWEKEDRLAARRAKKGEGRDPEEWKRWGSGYLAAREEAHRGCRAFFFGDVRKLTGEQVIDGIGTDEIAVVFGGPPCQGLSTANAKKCIEDPRNGMLWEFLRLVHELRPKTFIIENVPQLLTVAKGALFEALARKANEAGYNVAAQKLNACWYGVPQHRVRALIVGTAEGVPDYRFPMPSHWALGRKTDGRRWGFDQAGDEGRAVAEYDPETGTWSAPEEEDDAPDVQPSLFDEGVA